MVLPINDWTFTIEPWARTFSDSGAVILLSEDREAEAILGSLNEIERIRSELEKREREGSE
jgi:hypothetical protein